MAFVNVPKDLSKVKTKVALNLTKRQLICFGAAAIMGIPTYIFTRGAIGNSAGALLMIAIMFPLFFIGIYEKDGMPAEKILRNVIRTRFAWPGKRPYKTENLYEILANHDPRERERSRVGKEGKGIASQNKTAAKTPVAKRPAGKIEQSGRKKVRAKRKK
jgi:hypothetical protein